jgi:NADPH-dependent curcumin reductase CurA
MPTKENPMATSVNRQIHLASRPRGMPTHETFAMVEGPVPTPGDGEVLVRTLYLSVDPYMRGRMNEGKSYVPPFKLNQVLTGGVVGEVVASRDPALTPGDLVTGHLGWQDYSLAPAGQLQRVDPSLAPIETALGVLGMPGLTAYFGLLDLGRPQAGETVVVSGAAGAVGLVVGQIARLQGCRVVGIAGTERKTRYLKDTLGFDAAIDYKAPGDIAEALAAACPDGVDVYFDNVGGPISDAVMALINPGARIPICGQISLYNLETPDIGPRVQPLLLTRTAIMQGFLVGQFAARYPEALAKLAHWLRAGSLRYEETVTEGLEHAPDAFLGLFSGENLGKALVHVAGPTPRA